MKNYIQPGNVIQIASLAAAMTKGVGFKVGSLFGIAVDTAAIGEVGELAVEGVFEVAKLAADNMTLGLKVNWDDTNKWVKLATSDLDNVGTVVEAAGAASTKVKIKLTPV